MEIYLPIAEMSVHWLIIICMGGAVGFLSGMFGVGGGFLLAPMLMFFGIPPGVAVATTASHLTASSMSGAITQWRRRAIDVRMAFVMLTGGIGGTMIGVWLFALLEKSGQVDFVVAAAYVVMLGTIGGLMLNESIRTLRGGETHSVRRKPNHWINRLPLKVRFRESRLYISILPPALIGMAVGILSAILGVGGGFILVPAMIYILRMPTNVVIGTSLTQLIFVTASSTILHAVDNFAVDIVLAFLLILGGVVGAQYGVRTAALLRGEQLRFLLALLVLAVALRLLFSLVATPDDPFSVMMGQS